MAGGFEAGEGHVQRVFPPSGPWQGIPPLPPRPGFLVQSGPAGIGHSQDPGYLVKALPGGVVQGGTQNLHVRIVPDMNQHGVPAGDHQAEEGGLQLRVGQVVGGDVAPDVVHWNQGHIQGQGSSLGKVHPHQHRANEPRGIGDGNAVHILPLQPRPDQSLVRQAVNGLDVLTGRNFRHHAPVNPVQIHLGGDAVCENPPSVLHQGHSSLVAGGFHGHQYHKSHSFRRISPSSLGDR